MPAIRGTVGTPGRGGGGLTKKTGASRSGSALDLLVLRVGLADDADLPLAADDLAVFADTADAGANFHGWPLGGERIENPAHWVGQRL
jgi:hypothetical protein